MTEETVGKCICCGHSLHTPDKPLCHYCLHRSQVGCAKYLMLKSMLNNGNQFFTINEILQMNNELRRNLNIKEVKYDAARVLLRRYSKFYGDRKRKGKGFLLLVQPLKEGKNGRPKIRYRLSNRLIKRVNDYEKRWMAGLPINKRVKEGKKFKMTLEYKARANSIRMRIKSGKIGVYDHLMYLSKIK